MSWKNDIQANILRGLPATHARYLFLTATSDPVEPGGLRRTLERLVESYLRDAKWQGQRAGEAKPLVEPVVNLALTRPGLELLSGAKYVSDERRRGAVRGDEQEADAFAKRQGIHDDGTTRLSSLADSGLDLTVPNSMYRRLDLLREAPPREATDRWLGGWKQLIHALVWISASDEAGLDRVEADLQLQLEGSVAITHRLEGRVGPGTSQPAPEEAKPHRIDPFGFKDGTSQPAVDGFHERHEMIGRGAWTREGWRGLRAGEFVIGEKDEGHEVLRPQPERLLRHATYLAFRQIRMQPELLAELQNRYPRRPGETADDVGTWLVGRRRPDGVDQGSSLMRPGPDEDNDFIFGYDSEGVRCPLGAHVRRANPRDSMSKDGNRVNRHRIIRRGMPYWIPAEATDDGQEEVGLAFIALQSRLQDGFEFIQAHWLNQGSTLHVGEDPDPIAGVPARDVVTPCFVRQGHPAPVIGLDEPLTEVHGGEYFVMLTVPVLRELLGA